MLDKKERKKLYKIARKANELYELIRENNDILNVDARTKLKFALNKMENSICYKCRYSSAYAPYRYRYCRRNCHNYKDYGAERKNIGETYGEK